MFSSETWLFYYRFWRLLFASQQTVTQQAGRHQCVRYALTRSRLRLWLSVSHRRSTSVWMWSVEIFGRKKKSKNIFIRITLGLFGVLTVNYEKTCFGDNAYSWALNIPTPNFFSRSLSLLRQPKFDRRRLLDALPEANLSHLCRAEAFERRCVRFECLHLFIFRLSAYERQSGRQSAICFFSAFETCDFHFFFSKKKIKKLTHFMFITVCVHTFLVSTNLCFRILKTFDFHNIIQYFGVGSEWFCRRHTTDCLAVMHLRSNYNVEFGLFGYHFGNAPKTRKTLRKMSPPTMTCERC